MSQRARILLVRQKTNCKTQTTIFAKSTVSGLQVPSPSGTRVAKTLHIACRDSFRKPGPSCPALFFPCAPARNRFALRRRSLPSKKEGAITRPRSEHLIFLSGGRSGRQLRDSRTYAMALGDLRCCKRLLSYRASRNYLWCWCGYAASHNYPLPHARGQSLPDSARHLVRALY